jgi:hypothetical protein
MSADDKNLNELRDLWRAQPFTPGDWTREGFVTRVRAKARRHDRTIFWRNVQETAAGALLFGVMGWTSWLAPGWLPKAGGLIGMASVVFVIARLVRSRRAHPPVRQDLALVEWLDAEARKVEAEIHLLRSVRSWYVAPIFAGSAVWFGILVSLGLASLPIPRARLVLALALLTALSALIFLIGGWAVWKLNQYGVTRYLEPYLKELRELLDEIQTETEADSQ